MTDPRLRYHTPEELIARPDLGVEDKLAILETWELDARRLLTAEAENMSGGESSLLGRVLRARRALETASE